MQQKRLMEVRQGHSNQLCELTHPNDKKAGISYNTDYVGSATGNGNCKA